MKINYIYQIRTFDGVVIWVGQSVNPNRRFNEHRDTFGSDIVMEILEMDPVDVAASERYWIAYYRSLGAPLRNIANGGKDHTATSDETRRKIAKIWKGKKRPPELGIKMALATSGKPHNWTVSGREKASRTHFDEKYYNSLSAESKELMRQGSIRAASLSSEERTRRNKKYWDNATPEQLAERGAKIAAAQKQSQKIKDSWKNRTAEQKALHAMQSSIRKTEYWERWRAEKAKVQE